MSGRNSQVSRIYKILDLLEGATKGLTTAEIAERVRDCGHEVTKRTIYRDLEALNQAGFPLFPADGAEATTGSRWKLERQAKINDYLVLNSRELFSLYLARGVLAPLKESPFYRDIESTFAKLEAKLGLRGREFLEELSSEIHFEAGAKWGQGLNPDVLETVRASCAERQVLKVIYSSVNSGDKRERTLGAHYLYFAKGSIYLVAEDLEIKLIKVFSLARMSDAALTEKAYDGAVSDPEKFFEHSFGVFHGVSPTPVELLFEGQVAQFVRERNWHGSQKVSTNADGSVKLSLEIAITPEFIQWVLGFGPAVKVLSPDSLKKDVIAAARKVLALYGAKKAA